MPVITYIEADGTARRGDVPVGWSVMEGARKYNVTGIDADCGGACSCATCHVYIDEAWMARLPPKEDLEASLLDDAANVAANSRLSCQLQVTAEMDGLICRIPAQQD